MDRRKNRMLSALAALFALAAPAATLAWGAGTHTYVAVHTYKLEGRLEGRDFCRRVLGANGPDLFNYPFTDEVQLLAGVLHRRDASANVAPWLAATTADERSLGFGFASHNDAWGTDSTAHYDGITAGNTNGYVIAKAAVLGDLLLPAIWAQFPYLPEEVARGLSREVSHQFVELGVDFLLARADPGVGPALAATAACYDPASDPDFLVRALLPFLSRELPGPLAEAMTRALLPQFVAGLAQNGQALAVPFEYGLPAIAWATAEQSASYLEYKGLPPPPPEQLYPLIVQGILQAMDLCRPDFMAEISATTGRVNGKMSSLGIRP